MSSDVAEVEPIAGGSPDGWASGPVLNFMQLQRGHDLPVQDRKPGSVPIIASNGPVGWHDRSSIVGPGVITGRSGTIGNVRYVEGSYWPLNTTLYVRDFKGSDPRFVYYFLQNFPLTDHQSGTGVPTLNRNDVHAVWTAFPPLDEQRRIAEVLRSVDEAIAAADAVIGQLRETRNHRLEALMALPGTFLRIDEICRLSGGNGFPIKHQGKAAGQYPFAKVSDMNRPGNEVQMRHAENYVDDADLRTLKAKTFPVGTTFFPKVGATLLTNKRRIAAVEMLVDNNVMGAVATDIDPWFLYYAFCTIDMADYVQPGAVPSVNQRTIGQIMLPVPDRRAQHEFVATMRDIDTGIARESDALAELNVAKKALMSDLLSGRVRVPA